MTDIVLAMSVTKKSVISCFFCIVSFVFVMEARSESAFIKKTSEIFNKFMGKKEAERKPASIFKKKPSSKILLKEAFEENYDEDKEESSVNLSEALLQNKKIKNEIQRDLAQIKEQEKTESPNEERQISFEDLDVIISDRKEEMMQKK